MAWVAHMLHTPLDVLDDVDLEELLLWAEEATHIARLKARRPR